VLWTADRSRRVGRHDLAGDQPVEQHPDRGQLLLDRRRRNLDLQLLYISSNVMRPDRGWMRAQVTTVKGGMAGPSGWHYHVCEGQFLYVLKGWVEAEFADGTTLRAETGHSAFIPGGVIHNELRSSGDFEVLEVCLPADLGTVPCDPPAGRPQR
jgi:hypothetical protein